MDAASRGKRVGEQLMRWLEAPARAQGREKVTLDTHAVNRAARAFCRRLGYDPCGIYFVLELE